MTEGGMLKKITEAMKDLVTEANFDCSTTGISLQAMDSSHVSLVGLLLRADGFDHFRCDRNISLGINLGSMGKVLKCCNNDDIVTLKAEDNADAMTFMFGAGRLSTYADCCAPAPALTAPPLTAPPLTAALCTCAENQSQDRISDFELKLMDIDSEHLGIPDTEYKCQIKMPASEFQRICRDLAILGDTVTIAVTKDGVKITVAGEQRPWLHKKCIVFDDSYRHSVVHEGSEDRVVLALQIPNPEYMKKVKLGELDSFITGDSRLD